MDQPNIFINLPEQANSSLPDVNLTMVWKNLENRTIWISDEISESTLEVIDFILYFNREDKGLPKEDRKPIKLLINSPGGSLDVADSLISVIEASSTPIYGYAMGMVASAASTIYLACHKRFSLKNGYLILHKGSANMSGNYNEMMQAVEDYQKQVERMVKFYIERTTIPEEVIREKIKTDWYIYTDDAVNSGIVDVVIQSLDEVI